MSLKFLSLSHKTTNKDFENDGFTHLVLTIFSLKNSDSSINCQIFRDYGVYTVLLLSSEGNINNLDTSTQGGEVYFGSSMICN